MGRRITPIFGPMVRRRRRMFELSQAELADTVACSRVTLQSIERGNNVGFDLAARIARELEISIDDLILQGGE